MAKRLLDVLAGRTTDRVPFWFMRQAGRYLPEYRALRAEFPSFLDLVYNPEKAAEVTLQPIRRFAMDGAIIFSDILVIPDALGQDVEFKKGEGPVLSPIRGPGQIAELSLSGLDRHLAPVCETIARVGAALPGDVALIGFSGAPWTVATYMVEGGSSRDHAIVKAWADRDPREFARLIDLLVEATARYLIAQVRAGAEVLQIFDSWAGSLTTEGFERWSVGPTKALVKKVKESCPETPVIGFPKGAGRGYKTYFKETAVDCVGLDDGVDASWAAAELQPLGPVQGNLAPKLLLEGGRTMLGSAAAILETFSKGGHIFNLGHGIVPQVPPRHVEELSGFIKAWRRETG